MVNRKKVNCHFSSHLEITNYKITIASLQIVLLVLVCFAIVMTSVSFILQLSAEEDHKSMSSKHSIQYLDQPKLSKRTASALSVLTATMEGTSLKKLQIKTIYI